MTPPKSITIDVAQKIIDEVEATLKASCSELVAQHAERRAEKFRARDYEGYLLLHDGHKRLPAFLEIERVLPDKDFWRCLALTWDNIEVSAPDQDEWLRLFESPRSYRELLMSKSERTTLATIPETLKVYRGYAKGRARNGLSWTLSKEIARFFAGYANGSRRHFLCGHQPGGMGMVVAGKCCKSDVLAYFNGRGEQEIVINPKNVFAKR